jgi:hypothetical protein
MSEVAALCTRRVRVADPDVVFVRSVLEAYDGLVQWTGDGSGVLTLSVPAAQAPALDELLTDLSGEVALQVLTIF